MVHAPLGGVVAVVDGSGAVPQGVAGREVQGVPLRGDTTGAGGVAGTRAAAAGDGVDAEAASPPGVAGLKVPGADPTPATPVAGGDVRTAAAAVAAEAVVPVNGRPCAKETLEAAGPREDGVLPVQVGVGGAVADPAGRAAAVEVADAVIGAATAAVAGGAGHAAAPGGGAGGAGAAPDEAAGGGGALDSVGAAVLGGGPLLVGSCGYGRARKGTRGRGRGGFSCVGPWELLVGGIGVGGRDGGLSF